MLLKSSDSLDLFHKYGGGKATHLAQLVKMGRLVPPWFCIKAGAIPISVPPKKQDQSLEAYSKRAQETILNSALNENFTYAIKVELERLTRISHKHCSNVVQTVAPDVREDGEGKIFKPCREVILEADGVTDAQIGPVLCEKCGLNLLGDAVAVRSSGIGEDSTHCSFAGIHTSYLFQKEFEGVLTSVKKCLASAYSVRALHYRTQNNLPLDNIRIGVIIQKMVNAKVSGVAFSRSPFIRISHKHCSQVVHSVAPDSQEEFDDKVIKPCRNGLLEANGEKDAQIGPVLCEKCGLTLLEANRIVINSVFGIGEALVNGEEEGEQYEVDRITGEVLTKRQHLQEKNSIEKSSESGDLRSQMQPIPSMRLANLSDKKDPGYQLFHEENFFREELTKTLSPKEAQEIAKMAIELEEYFGHPQDIEWAIDGKGTLHLLQTRPITTLPTNGLFANQDQAILWDNSNIIESYSGVTSPLTFSFARSCYEEVYRQFCHIIGASKELIQKYDAIFKNMLGFIRGRIYYNLANWYRLSSLIPGAANNKEFMETMMGVKESLTPEITQLIELREKPPVVSFFSKVKLTFLSFWRFFTIDSIVCTFQSNFDAIYNDTKKQDFTTLSLKQQIAFYRTLEKTILQRWQAPIINDCICMIFFGLLKKLTTKWIGESPSLQNDLLCGEGGLESAEPTKMLMSIAKEIDEGDRTFRKWFISSEPEEVFTKLEEHSPLISVRVHEFLEKYGFRCVNELKLEEDDLHDDPSFVIDALCTFVKMKTYDLAAMEEREKKIRTHAKHKAFSKLRGLKKILFIFVLKQARKAIRNREEMRFSRTKIFGIVRHLFRAIGMHLVSMDALENRQDIFFLTVEEIFAFIEGRSVDHNLLDLVTRRKEAYLHFSTSPPPPERFLTFGPVGISVINPKWFACMATTSQVSDPNKLTGTPCSPGIVEGTVRVVKELKEARRLNNEILVTEKTDPGWVPLFPSCSGILIERGSLLSHSAIVARELGIPTIVNISDGLMHRLKTGMKVRMDATRGTVEII